MSAERIQIIEETRPPTASFNGRSPVRIGNMVAKQLRINKKLNQSVDKIQSYQQPHAKYISGDEQQVNSEQWNQRHHVTSSQFNKQNHTYYKQYFDKPQRISGTILMRPKRMLDPYEMNAVRGTRMPDYSQLYKQRDVYGELGWTLNFNVTFSKNNDNLHPTYKEFFDQPKNYHQQFNNSNLTVSQFFRQTAPRTSVAKEKKYRRSASLNKTTMNQTIASSAALSDMTAPSHTPYYYVKEPGNSYKYDKRIEYSTIFTNTIPFLRDNESELLIKQEKARKKSYQNSANQTISTSYNRTQQKKSLNFQQDYSNLRQAKIRERGWKQLMKPISQINEGLHISQKIVFEKI